MSTLLVPRNRDHLEVGVQRNISLLQVRTLINVTIVGDIDSIDTICRDQLRVNYFYIIKTLTKTGDVYTA